MEQQNERNDAQQPEAENYPLDDTMIQMRGEIMQQIQALQAQLQGALILFIRQHGLQGTWRVAENDKELVKTAEQQAVPPRR